MIACYVACNEADVIAESLRSVKAYVERFVVVDAVFSANPLEATHSTDNQREVCERICAPVPLTYIEADRKLPQEAARNRYLDEVPEGEWIVNLDGDEVLYVDYFVALEVMSWLQHGNDVDAINVPILSAAVLNTGMALDIAQDTYETAPIVHTQGYAPRFFRNRAALRYREYIAPNGIVDNQGLYEGTKLLASKAPRDARMTIVNHHVRQSWQGYQADAIWEAINVLPAAEHETHVRAIKRRLAGLAA
jgi:hypothetical protein